MMLMTAVEPKGRPTLRPVPDDFDVIFVEQGRQGCESWYRARKQTITRWLIERGKDRLIKARAAYVKHQRSQGKWLTRSTCMVEHRTTGRSAALERIHDRRTVSIALARQAAQHLRVIRNGGFIVSQAPQGDWRVGTRLLSAAQMVDLACAKGFDPWSVQPPAGTYVPPKPDEAAPKFPCGHPRTPLNIRRKAGGRERCRTCNRRHMLTSIRRVRAAKRAALHSAQSPAVDS